MAVFTGNGSAASPSITFSGDTNTGVFTGAADDTVRIANNGQEHVRITADGDLQVFETDGDPATGNSILFDASAGSGTFSGTIAHASYGSEYGLQAAVNTANEFCATTIAAGTSSVDNLNRLPFKIVYNDGVGSNNKFAVRSSGTVYIGGTISNDADTSTPNLSLNADGSAEFASDLTVGTLGGSPRVQLNANSAYVRALRSDGKQALLSGSATNGLGISDSGDVKASIGWDGSAEFTGAVKIGGSAAANEIDEYEEGTWVPKLRGSGQAGTITYSVQEGRYVKIGRVVTVWGRFGINTITGATNSTWFQTAPYPVSSDTTNIMCGAWTRTGSSDGITNAGVLLRGLTSGWYGYRQTTTALSWESIGSFAVGNTVTIWSTYLTD